MITAFDVLFRYTVNMLKLKRPRNWYTIKFSNAQFKARADCMVGTRDILMVMGYTSPSYSEDGITQTGLSYPDPSQINYDIIKLIGAELLTAKTEVKMAHEGRGNVSLKEGLYDSMQPSYSHTISPPMRPSYTEQHTFQDKHQPSQQSDMFPSYPSTYSSQPSEINCHSGQPRQDSWASQHYKESFKEPSNDQFDFPLSSRLDMQPTRSSSNQRHDYQHNMQTAQSEDTSNIPVYSSQVSSPPDLSPGGGNSRLEALKQRKANAIRIFHENSGDVTNNPPPLSGPTTRPVRHAPTAPLAVLRETPPQPKPRRNRPVPPNQPSVNPPSTYSPPSSDIQPSSSLPEAAPPTDVPVQKPHVPRTAVRIMMECDACGYPNHEKLQKCTDCGNPKNGWWTRVEIPVKMRNAPPNNEPTQPMLPRPAPDDDYSRSPDRTSHQPSLNTTPSPHGATGSATSTPLKDYLPPPKYYTPAQKAEMQRQAELARQQLDSEAEMKKMQQQPSMPIEDKGASLNDYLPQNNQYNLRTEDRNNRLTGNALQPFDMGDGESAQHYKDLGKQGNIMVQDLKVMISVFCRLTISILGTQVRLHFR